MENNFYKCNVDDLHKAQLDILKVLDGVCRKKGLRYYLCCGTCLGAIRHKGFIPWDSDIDVFMYHDEVEKLISLQEEFPSNYFIQSYKNDPGYGSTCIRIRKSDTTFIEPCDENDDINHGVWIDIYPVYYCPNNKIKLTINIYLSFFYRLMVADRIPENHGGIVKIACKLLLSLISNKSKETIIKRIESRLRSCPDRDNIYHYYGGSLKLAKANISKSEWFEAPKELEFEGELFLAPTNPEDYLSKTYGEYMKLPPLEEQKVKFDGAFIDTNNSYTIYKGKKYCV